MVPNLNQFTDFIKPFETVVIFCALFWRGLWMEGGRIRLILEECIAYWKSR